MTIFGMLVHPDHHLFTLYDFSQFWRHGSVHGTDEQDRRWDAEKPSATLDP